MVSGWYFEMVFKTGYLYFINPCRASIPVKPKFAICMSTENSLFYLVNSCDDVRPYKHEEGHVVYIPEAKFKTLSRRSYVNVSKPRIIEPGDYVNTTEKEYVPNDLWIKIKSMALKDKSLSVKFKEMIDTSRTKQ